MDAEPIPIRRYPNRRFYDRNRRRYVTLHDIEALVCEGHTVEVRDSRSGEDLTRLVLTQILLERHPDKMDLFPVAMLHSLLRTNDLVVEFWRGCVRRSLAALEGLQQQAGALGVITGPLDWMGAFFPGLQPPGDAGADAPDLAGRVAALEERIGRLEIEAGPVLESEPSPAGGDPIDRLERRVLGLERHLSSDANSYEVE